MTESDTHTVLIIEDDEGLNRLIQKRLSAEGYTVLKAFNGIQALDTFEQTDAKMLVLLDYLLPDMKAEEIIEKLQQKEGSSFIIMTGHGDETIAVDMMKLGAKDYLVKDTSFLDLLPAVVKRAFDELTTQYRLTGAEKALRQANKILSSVVGASPLAIISLDSAMHVNLWNKSAERIFGWDEAAVLGRDIPFLTPESYDEFNHHIHSVMQGTGVSWEIMEARRQCGSTVAVRIYSEPILGDGESIEGAMAIIEDISEKIKASRDRKNLEDQLLRSQKLEAVGTLAGGIAHDFNNILTTVQGYSDILLMKIDETDPMHRDAKQIRLAAGKGASLVKQLLIFSRKQPMELQILSLNAVIENLLKMLKRLIGEDISIKTDLDPELLSVMGDEANIEQILMNLTVNARDAMPEGGVITIRTENRTVAYHDLQGIPEAYEGLFVCLRVADTGCGMDKETLERMYEPFFSRKRHSGGTGLGLSTVYGIVTYHKGWIAVDSAEGSGTEFSLYFPATVQKAEVKLEKNISLDLYQGRGEHILVVEDDPAIRDVALTILGDNGYRATVKSTAEEAREFIVKAQDPVDLIISDVVLPGMSGLQLIEDLTAENNALKFILCSGYADQKSQSDVIQQRGYPFIAKPYTIADFLRIIQNTLTK